VRICAKGHKSPRSADACSECGSPELSQPQPRRRLAAVAGFATLRALIGAALLAGTIGYGIAFAFALVRDPNVLFGRMLVGLGIGLLWLAFVFVA
jgi:hypothetical protein